MDVLCAFVFSSCNTLDSSHCTFVAWCNVGTSPLQDKKSAVDDLLHVLRTEFAQGAWATIATVPFIWHKDVSQILLCKDYASMLALPIGLLASSPKAYSMPAVLESYMYQ